MLSPSTEGTGQGTGSWGGRGWKGPLRSPGPAPCASVVAHNHAIIRGGLAWLSGGPRATPTQMQHSLQERPGRVPGGSLLQDAFSGVPNSYLTPCFAQVSYPLNRLHTSKCVFYEMEKSQGETGNSALPTFILWTAETSLPSTLQSCCSL